MAGSHCGVRHGCAGLEKITRTTEELLSIDNHGQSVLVIYDYLFDGALREHKKCMVLTKCVATRSGLVPGGTLIITT